MLAQGPPPEGAADASIEIKSSIGAAAVLLLRRQLLRSGLQHRRPGGRNHGRHVLQARKGTKTPGDEVGSNCRWRQPSVTLRPGDGKRVDSTGQKVILLVALGGLFNCTQTVCGETIEIKREPAKIDFQKLPSAPASSCYLLAAARTSECWDDRYLRACKFEEEPRFKGRAFVSLSIDGRSTTFELQQCLQLLERAFVLVPEAGSELAPATFLSVAARSIDGGSFLVTTVVSKNRKKDPTGGTAWCGRCVETIQRNGDSWLGVEMTDDERSRAGTVFGHTEPQVDR